MCVLMCVCMYVCIYICIYIHTYTHICILQMLRWLLHPVRARAAWIMSTRNARRISLPWSDYIILYNIILYNICHDNNDNTNIDVCMYVYMRERDYVCIIK